MQKQSGSFLSSDGQHRIHTVIWLPAQGPKAVLQIVYGMAEYAERYEPVARFFTKQGLAVAIHDHLGHGKSIRSRQELGYFGPNGQENLIEDSHLWTQRLHQIWPTKPLFILGHSMGSIITSLVLGRYAADYTGGILMGNVYLPKILAPVMPMIRWKAKLTAKRPDHGLNILAFGLYSWYFDRLEFFSWLSNDPAEIEKYKQDPLLGFTFTTNGFLTLFTLLQMQAKGDWLAQLPKDFPLLAISGRKDPVGDFGKQQKWLAQMVANNRLKKVTKKEWPELRHELFFERQPDRTQVETYIANWLQQQMFS
ncbi:alpha/beta hydrolase [Lactobacillus sp. CC-MHH1034]|uniref:alpha/beta fold hydrolase n=1 Tax=Agrilactobacillus fermenti TaxID=2586909 RepID=UPI001E33897B|nr:alpha/beta hydrolase [Agrilactobacillus fermenti]MCD2255684.1 alpha/beta hydrolase [Agrilactobacillus fermenti]